MNSFVVPTSFIYSKVHLDIDVPDYVRFIIELLIGGFDTTIVIPSGRTASNSFELDKNVPVSYYNNIRAGERFYKTCFVNYTPSIINIPINYYVNVNFKYYLKSDNINRIDFSLSNIN